MSVLRTRDRRRAPSKLFLLDFALLGAIFWAAYHTYVSIGLGQVYAVSTEHDRFWADRVADMQQERCEEADKMHALPALHDDAVKTLVNLRALAPRRDELWRAYTDCQEPKTFLVDEELLHFKVDKDAEFEGDPERGFQAIRRYVDEQVASRRAIFVLGHTDDSFTDQYNNELSYRRARTVAGLIEAHLAIKGLRPGKDFAIYPIGMGETQLLPREGRDEEAWRKACRRIELSFRGRGVGSGSHEQAR